MGMSSPKRDGDSPLKKDDRSVRCAAKRAVNHSDQKEKQRGAVPHKEASRCQQIKEKAW